jgi:hypothetical protein
MMGSCHVMVAEFSLPLVVLGAIAVCTVAGAPWRSTHVTSIFNALEEPSLD